MNVTPSSLAAPADAAERDQALNPELSYIVQAPAGSGKTELLTRRILTLLTRVSAPEEILAITFTRKAASEMRQRVLSVLQAAVDDEPINGDHEVAGRKLALAVLQHSETNGWNLLEHPARLQLQTIDSLCAVLTRQLPVTSSLGASLEVQDNSQAFYQLAAERCLQGLLDFTGEPTENPLSTLLLHFSTDVDRLQRMMADMLANRDQWLRHYGSTTHDDARQELEDNLQALVDDRFRAINAVCPDIVKQKLPPLMHHAVHCADVLGGSAGLRGIVDHEVIPEADLSTGRFWQSIADLLLTQDTKGAFRKSPNRLIGFPTNPADAEAVELEVAELKEKKAGMVALLKELGEFEDFKNTINECRFLPLNGFSDEQWEILQSLYRLLITSVAELNLVFAEAGAVDFNQISMTARQALGSEGAPTDIALSMDHRIRHILVDEFQDTSLSQFELFEQLVAGWEPNDGRTFFAVGDPMQSIYRFRDAEVGLFSRAQQSGIGQITMESLTLSCNFRSDPILVEQCNSYFKKVFPSRVDPSSGAVPYSESTAFKPNDASAHFYLHPSVGENKEEEAARVVSLIEKALAEDHPPESVALLVRAKAELRPVFRIMQQRGIPYQAIDIETLGDRLVVKDLVSMCRALQQPLDRLSWVSILRAPMCGLTLTDLHALLADFPKRSVWSQLQGTSIGDLVSPDGQLRINRFITAMKPAMNRALRDPLVPWIEATWLRLGGPSACIVDSDLAAADACIKELGRIESLGSLWDQKFVLAQMEKLFAPASTLDTPVQMMTIHKSKGLEFDMVILPSMGKRPRAQQSGLLNWIEFQRADFETGLLMTPADESGVENKSRDPILKLVQTMNQKKADNELIRLLYVAMTRAKRRLHLVGHATLSKEGEIKANNGSLLNALWAVCSDSFVAPEQITDEPDPDLGSKADKSAAHPMLMRLSAEWECPDVRSAWYQMGNGEVAVAESSTNVEVTGRLQYDWVGLDARLIGTVIHRQIQRISDDGIGAWSTERVMEQAAFFSSLLTAAGVSEENLKDASDRVVRALVNLLEDTRGRWLLGAEHSDAHTEFRVTGISDGRLADGIIDRTFRDEDGVRWIVDFKTGEHGGANLDAFLDNEQARYKDQLERYAVVMSAMDSSKQARPGDGESGQKVRMGLYFPLQRGWREWSINT